MTRDLPLGLTLYRTATAALAPLVPLILAARKRAGKEDPDRLQERLGRTKRFRPDGPLIWLHGASVGESLSHLPLITALKAELPDAQFLVTSGTTTSAALLEQRLPDYAQHQYLPVDTPRAAKAFLKHWKPNLAIFVESEIWPNLLLTARERQIPTALVSARLSKKSQKNWTQHRDMARVILGGFDLVLPQDEASQAFFEQLGLGIPSRLNLKFTGTALPLPAGVQAPERAPISRPLILAASTHAGEEALVLKAFSELVATYPAARLILVPRHPNRSGEIIDLMVSEGVSPAVRSKGDALEAVPGGGVYLADTLGELGLWFRMANTALICGALRPGIGGHNPLEPARLSCPAFSGPHVENWLDAYGRLEGKVPFVEVSPHAIARALMSDLHDPALAAYRAELAAQIAAEGQGDLSQAATRLAALVRERRERLA